MARYFQVHVSHVMHHKSHLSNYKELKVYPLIIELT